MMTSYIFKFMFFYFYKKSLPNAVQLNIYKGKSILYEIDELGNLKQYFALKLAP